MESMAKSKQAAAIRTPQIKTHKDKTMISLTKVEPPAKSQASSRKTTPRKQPAKKAADKSLSPIRFKNDVTEREFVVPDVFKTPR